MNKSIIEQLVNSGMPLDQIIEELIAAKDKVDAEKAATEKKIAEARIEVINALEKYITAIDPEATFDADDVKALTQAMINMETELKAYLPALKKLNSGMGTRTIAPKTSKPREFDASDWLQKLGYK